MVQNHESHCQCPILYISTLQHNGDFNSESLRLELEGEECVHILTTISSASLILHTFISIPYDLQDLGLRSATCDKDLTHISFPDR